MPSGGSGGGTYWVLLVSGRVCRSKAVLPEARKHFLTSSARYHSHFIGGSGLRDGVKLVLRYNVRRVGPQIRYDGPRVSFFEEASKVRGYRDMETYRETAACELMPML